jgi:hypothetical protein
MTSSPHVVVTQVVTTRPPQLLQSVLVGRAGLLLPHPNQHPRQGRKARRQPQQERTLGRGCSQQAKVPIILKGGKSRRITLTEILRDLESLNEGRDKRDRITYDSLWVHAKRHYDLAGIAAYWRSRADKEFKEFKMALRGQRGVGRLLNSPREAGIKYEES